MSTITVPLPDEDLAFLRALAQKRGISPEEFLALQTRNLREQFQKPLHPDVAAAIGIISADSDEKAYREYIEKKYQ
ncbi:MAG TPA: hypothetical protein VHY22_08960 [Chthoniobacteraceae bacterium]|jgi:hypothetical protein|nr:hypothetical protein [Chthoniobacteraceae bacterium]